MRRDLLIRWLRVSVAVLVLAISLVSRVPTSHCKCHDPQPVKKEVCPFGELRQLSRGLILVAPVSLEAPAVGVIPLAPTPVITALRPLWTHSTAIARAPPGVPA